MTMKEPNPLIWDERLTQADEGLVAELNASLERLNCSRPVEINVSGPFARSKIAWKLAIYQHLILHRIVALMNGVAIAWNNHCTLSAILSARALMETIAVMAEFDERVVSFLASEDLGELDALAQRGIFATRDAEWLVEFPEYKATNILTYIDKFDKRLPGFKGHYDRLSERCHPNAAGHNSMFSELDRSTGSVRFFDEREPSGNGQMIFAALIPLQLIESIMTRLDDSIIKVSDLHHRISPVGGGPSVID